MTRYFLSRVRVEGFRGINNEGYPLDLKFRADAVNSVFAVNGIGKSSLFEALSYAISNRVPKLEDLQAQEHPEDYVCNRFHSQRKAIIDLEFEPDDGTGTPVTVRVERSAAGKRTVSSPSGHPDSEALLAGLNENFILLDYRTFARFIDDSPLARGRSFSALLGLSAYSDMRQCLQAASDTRSMNTDFEIRTINASMEAAQQASQQALASMLTNYERITGKAIHDVGRLDEHMAQAGAALGGVELLKPYFDGKALADVNFDAVKKGIREAEGGEKRKDLERAVEAITKLEALGSVETEELAEEHQGLSRLLNERDSLLAETRGSLSKKLYEVANALIERGEWTDDAKCPLCLGTVDTSIKAHVESHLEQYRGVAEKIAQIQTSWTSARWVKRLSTLETAEIIALDPKERLSASLAQRAASGELTKEDLARGVAQLDTLEKLIADKLSETKARKEALEKELPASLVQLTEQVEYGRQFKESAATYHQEQKEEAALRAILQMRERWRRFISHATTVFSEAEAGLSKTKIGTIDNEYKSMFKAIMNVGDIVPDLQRTSDKEDLHVQLSDFHGQHGVSARALLSESYRNALAIAVFLSAALKHNGPPRFVVLDDVTSSFDAGHQYFLMEHIRGKLQQPQNPKGLQFIILSHDGLLEKYFDRHGSTGDWRHHRLEGSPPMGAIMSQTQDANRVRTNIITFLDAGQVTQAEPLLRQYLEYKLQQIIRKVDVPVPIDFAMKDHSRMVSNCLDAITAAVKLHEQAGNLVLDAQQVQDLKTAHVPALVGNWVSHYETGSGSSLSAPMLKGVVKTIDDLAECFRFDETVGGGVTRKWYRSLSSRT